MDKKNEYIVRTGNEEMDRIDIYSEVYKESSENLLRKSGLKSDMVVADFGCGIGNTSCLISEMMDNTGIVYGFDSNEEQLEIANSRLKKLQKIKYSKEDVYNLSNYESTFDLIYCRFLLINLLDVKLALKSMISTLKPNGIIAFEDLPGFSVISYPYSKAANDQALYLGNIYKENKFDNEIGLKLKELYSEFGIVNISSNIATPMLDTTYKRKLLYVTMNCLKSDYKPDMDEELIKKELAKLIDNDDIFLTSWPIAQASGVKK